MAFYPRLEKVYGLSVFKELTNPLAKFSAAIALISGSLFLASIGVFGAIYGSGRSEDPLQIQLHLNLLHNLATSAEAAGTGFVSAGYAYIALTISASRTKKKEGSLKLRTRVLRRFARGFVVVSLTSALLWGAYGGVRMLAGVKIFTTSKIILAGHTIDSDGFGPSYVRPFKRP